MFGHLFPIQMRGALIREEAFIEMNTIRFIGIQYDGLCFDLEQKENV